jgi:hypothetical protein
MQNTLYFFGGDLVLDLVQKNMWQVSKHPELGLYIDHSDLKTELLFICLLLVSMKNED